MVAKTMQPTKSVPVKPGESSGKPTKKGKKKKTKHVAAMRDEDEVDYTNIEDEIYFKVLYAFFLFNVHASVGNCLNFDSRYLKK